MFKWIDGRAFRKRRGKMVEIPPEWVGEVVHDQTRRKRPSQQTPAQRDSYQRKTGKSGYFLGGIRWKEKALLKADHRELEVYWK